MTSERVIQAEILARFGADSRFYLGRQNTGVFVGGVTVAQVRQFLPQAYPVRCGVPGQSDLVGILRGDSDCSHPMGRYFGLEVKTDNTKQTTEQIAFERMVLRNGGLYEVVRSVDDVSRAIDRWLE